ncbi:MAG: 1,2-phenylacetyl-CoA epoxidase subunit PaaC [Rhizobiaceae bacterium]
MDTREALVHSLITLGDDHLILGHRLSEWSGHAPMLEEDLSMSNMALDLIGQARNIYTYAGEVEGKGRDEDALAYLRTEREYYNVLMVERPNGDFAHTMLRQFYFAVYMQASWAAMVESKDETLRGIAGKAVKEISYHVRHAGEWVVRMGDGTEESAERIKSAAAALHRYTNELFTVNSALQICIDAGSLPDPSKLRDSWNNSISQVFKQAFLEVPEVAAPQEGGRDGRHTEDFGHLLSDLQYLQRTYPGQKW